MKSPAYPFRQPFIWIHAHLYKSFLRFIHTFIERTWIPYCRKHFSFILLAFLLYPFNMHCSGWVRSNETPFGAAAGYYYYYLLRYAYACSISLSFSFFVWNSFPSYFKWCFSVRWFSCTTRNRNWCTFRVDCRTKWYGGVESVAAYMFIMN